MNSRRNISQKRKRQNMTFTQTLLKVFTVHGVLRGVRVGGTVSSDTVLLNRWHGSVHTWCWNCSGRAFFIPASAIRNILYLTSWQTNQKKKKQICFTCRTMVPRSDLLAPFSPVPANFLYNHGSVCQQTYCRHGFHLHVVLFCYLTIMLIPSD